MNKKIIIKSLLYIIIIFFLGVFITPGKNVKAENKISTDYIEITNLESLNYIDKGKLIFEYVRKSEEDYEIFNIYFEYNDKYYLKRSLGLPPILSSEALETATYTVKDDDNGNKRVYINFKLDDNYCTWELTTGEYIANNIVTITSAILDVDINSALKMKWYYVYFSVDLEMDDIYQIDVEYETFEKFLFWDVNHTKIKKTIMKNKEVRKDTKVFNDFFDRLLSRETDYRNIKESDNDKYQWKAEVASVSENVYMKNFVIIKIYYVTNGQFLETDEVIMDPIDDPILENKDDFEWFKNFLVSAYNWFDKNKNSIALIIVGFIITYFLGSIFPKILVVFGVIFKSFLTIIKVILFVIKLPFMIINTLFNKKSNKLKYNYKI